MQQVTRGSSPLLKWFVVLVLVLSFSLAVGCGKEAEKIISGGESTKKNKGPDPKHVANEPYNRNTKKTDAERVRDRLNDYHAYLIKGGATANPPETLEAAIAVYNKAATPMTWVNKDKWGNPYQYKAEARGKYPFTVYSMGPDGQDGTADDVFPIGDKTNRKAD